MLEYSSLFVYEQTRMCLWEGLKGPHGGSRHDHRQEDE
jgi:hypothetical protein